MSPAIWLAVALLAACVRPAPRQPVVPLPPAPIVTPASPGPWRPVPSAETDEYTVAIATRVDDPDHPALQPDSSHALMRLSWRAPSRTVVSGLVRDAKTWTSSPDQPQLQSSGVAFAGSRVGAMLKLTVTGSVGPAPCAGADWGFVAWARDLDLALPDIVEPGQAWTDSATYDVCRNSLPLHVRVQRSFRAISVSRESAVAVIERTSTSVIEGQALSDGDTTRVSGRASGTLRYEVEIPSGRPIRAQGTAMLTLAAQNRASRASARQTSLVEITRSPRP